MKKLISTAVLVAAMLAAKAQAQTPTNSVRVPVNWSDPSRPGLVTVRLLLGAISVRTHSGKDVIIESNSSGRRGRGPEVTTDGLRRIDQNGNGLTIEEANNVLTVSSPNFGRSATVDIQVPVKTNLKLETITGNAIVVDGVDGQIEVTNMKGDIKLVNVSGSVVAHTQNGNLFASVREVTPNKAMSLTSFNGNIDLTLAPATKANLKLRTDVGEAWTDIEIKRAPASPPVVNSVGRGGTSRITFDTTINGTINGGGPDIELRTFHGNIYLRKAK